MSARITIQSGISAGTSHRIDRRVARVGSDPQSDICLPTANVPGHALTLEFLDDECRVYNRCRDSVYIGPKVVGPDEVGHWPETDILQLGEEIELLLDFSDVEEAQFDDYEMDEPTDRHNPEPQPTNAAQPTSSSSAKTALQLGVTILCVIGCVLLLVRDQSQKVLKVDAVSFTDVVKASLSDPLISGELIRRVQYAEAQRVRGNEDASRIAFADIRRDLRSKTEAGPKHLEKVLRLVNSRLSD